MLRIWWCIKGVIYWELLPEKTTLNAYSYRAQLNKLDDELINNGLFSRKIYFQLANAKPNVTQIIKEKISLKHPLVPFTEQ